MKSTLLISVLLSSSFAFAGGGTQQNGCNVENYTLSGLNCTVASLSEPIDENYLKLGDHLDLLTDVGCGGVYLASVGPASKASDASSYEMVGGAKLAFESNTAVDVTITAGRYDANAVTFLLPTTKGAPTTSEITLESGKRVVGQVVCR